MYWLNRNRIKLVFVGVVAVMVLGGGTTKADLVMEAVRVEEDLPNYFGHGESFSNDGLRLYIAGGVPGGYG